MKISIITVNYNDRSGLEQTIKSVIGQTFRDYEYIIIDGCSSDGSVELIKQYEKDISYWVSEPDNGIYNAMNKAIDVVNGEYCIFMNSGDSFSDENTLYDVFSTKPMEDIICGNTVTVNKIRYAPEEITLNYMFCNTLCHQSVIIKSHLMKKYKYDENLKIVADRKFLLQALIIDNCSYKKVDVNIADYDINGFSSNNPVLSRIEYDAVLEELIPQRIRIDYGRVNKGSLYGDTWYDKLFVELRNRQYRKLVYSIVVVIMRICSLFQKSARFITIFPFRIK